MSRSARPCIYSQRSGDAHPRDDGYGAKGDVHPRTRTKEGCTLNTDWYHVCMTHVDLDDMRALLDAEKAQLEEDLAAHGKNVTGTNWEGSSSDIHTNPADFTEVADQIEELTTNVPLVEELERRYRDINDALKRVDDNKFGLCDVCNIEIPADRLEANPAAKTCIEHTA